MLRDVLNIITRTIVGRSFHKAYSLTDSWGGGGGVRSSQQVKPVSLSERSILNVFSLFLVSMYCTHVGVNILLWVRPYP